MSPPYPTSTPHTYAHTFPRAQFFVVVYFVFVLLCFVFNLMGRSKGVRDGSGDVHFEFVRFSPVQAML